MIEVFITNVSSEIEAKAAVKAIEASFRGVKVDFDLNETGRPYPCGHTIIRVQGYELIVDEIAAAITKLGYACEVLEDKICR